MTKRDFERGVRAGMLVALEETATALELGGYDDAAGLVRKAIAAHIERCPEVAGLATSNPEPHPPQ